jgi:peptidoglycan/xylan/chitin deacetylase (PgdA/CDA1 family)
VFDVALSFDNGPEPEVTPHVLDVLAHRNVKTTFFVIGKKLTDTARRAL